MAFTNLLKQPFTRAESDVLENPMTMDGTVAKLSLLLCILTVTSAFGWYLVQTNTPMISLWLIASFIGAFVLSLITMFSPRLVQFCAIPYTCCQGFILGSITRSLEYKFPGIALIAVTLTISTAAGILALYRLRIIQVTETVKATIIAATLGIGLTYFVGGILMLLRIIPSTFFDNTSQSSIILSLFAVIVAASNLLLDFNLIEESINKKLPKYMEWYAAFTVIVTLIWLYIEMIRLAQKLAKKKEA